jgi:hypothetical protein
MRAQASAPVHLRPCSSTACIQRMATSRSICGNRSCTEGSCRSKNSMRSRVSNGRTRATLTRQRLQAPSYRTVSLVIFQVGVGRVAILPSQRRNASAVGNSMSSPVHVYNIRPFLHVVRLSPDLSPYR